MAVKVLSSVVKTLSLLEVIAEHDDPIRLADLSHKLGEGRGTIYQRLMTLVEVGWLEQPEPGTYRLSLQLATIGQAALEQASFGERTTAVLRELALDTEETASLAVLSGIQAQIIKRVESHVVVRAEVRVGTLLSLSDSSSGRVLTAFADADYRGLLKQKGARLASEKLLKEVRDRGYAVSSGKDVAGVRSVAVPLFDKKGNCAAALSVVTPEARFDSDRLIAPLLQASRKLKNATVLY
ncbi:IclR family transcriptional regulator [Nitratireductor mangrovi]|uniref:IclR family transcriptional regulator n=1 Tax=Nitratireductor mangrovi TaxID=2599600 RepID=A0A5B8KU74_9HYPH|nr:IclR family transcriptional regulator [Nitratireductor mangrovi]QDY99154.1 IclR family transcriptional regulator [Nitratireductor mangrovi]